MLKPDFFHNQYPFSENQFLTRTRNDVTTPLVAGDDSGVI